MSFSEDIWASQLSPAGRVAHPERFARQNADRYYR